MKTYPKENIPGVIMPRRSFLRHAGVGAVSAGLLATAACHKGNQIMVRPNKIDIGKGDLSILNYAYALEQIEAAFYTQLIQTPYTDITTDERALFTTIRDQEILHREFFKAALGLNAIPDLVFDFSTIDFTTRSNVLFAAKSFEDIGVLAYVGSGHYVQNKDYLTITAKITSVEARHAALLSNMIVPGTFNAGDQVDGNGLNKFLGIPDVLYLVNSYLKTKVAAVYYDYQV
ncbi:ferritin-like domain-containing protein [Mucilaginibacter aquaedulcis]|uniref:ferritin-like domain-containing protein n=1 Tax=Mucilaginibacter aquaedulcis TaxID=1187081 RepID=UPI0025B4E78C|nr:ferritin-like domain-containing protein [Mucilaginibacter aquaedulcis]MDN3551143.1 ferritin-like domain-containing protein [Mucilaginibacter aquaedulcis]